MGGANTTRAGGTYGTLGIGSTTNVPGARYRPIAWIDTTGNLRLFGGYFIDPTGAFGDFNDF
jgi:hypothetical protein